MTKIIVRSVYNSKPKGAAINITTSGVGLGREFSPMLLGPVSIYQGKDVPPKIAKNVENGWQYSKVYAHHDDNGKPNAEWYEWRDEGFSNKWACRYPMGRGAIPLYSWIGKPIDYIEARKTIYVPSYKMAVHKLDELFNNFLYFVDSEELVTLLDYDVYPGDTADELTFQEILNNPKVKMGHAYVLADMLRGALDARQRLQ